MIRRGICGKNIALVKRFVRFISVLIAIGICSFCSAQEKAKITFDENLNLVAGDITIEPLQSKNLTFAEGINGKAVVIPSDGYLQYPVNDLISPEEGTIILWIKLNTTPSGIMNFRDRDRLANGDWGDKVWGSEFNRMLFDAGGIKARLNSFISFNALGTADGMMILKQMFKDEWHQLAFTWKANGIISEYLDGILISAKQSAQTTSNLRKTLTIGSGAPYPGIDAKYDDFQIYKKQLSEKEILQDYTRYRKLRIELLDYSLETGKPNTLRFRARNISDEPQQDILNIEDQKITIDLQPDELTEFSVTLTPDQPGLFQLQCNPSTTQMKTFELYALAPQQAPVQTDTEIHKSLLQEIDCTETPPDDTYADAGTCRVVNDYRESTILETGIGFAYRMKIQHPGTPHWLEVEYPDNATRSFIVFVYPYKYNRIYTLSLDNIGIITGGNYPLTGKNHTKHLLFWPDCDEVAITSVAYRPMKNHSGPAVCKLKLYENNGPLPVANVPAGGRSLGLWQEDPTMTAGLWFTNQNNFKEANLNYWKIKWSRVIDYMRFNGFNSWVIQSMDYHGDVSSMDATLQIPSSVTSHSGRVPGWDAIGAQMLDRENLNFYIRLNPLPRITTNWFARFIDEKDLQNVQIVKNDGTIDDTPRANVNPLHPKVQQAYINIIRAYRDKFSKYKGFKGICFNEHLDFSLQKIEYGYDDFSCKLFEKETGCKIRATSLKDRYLWLMENAKQQWIDWRCAKITAFAAELGKTMQEKGDKSLHLQLWVGAYRFLDGLDDWPDYNPQAALRNAGIDLAALSNLPGITVVPIVRPDYSRTSQKVDNEEYLIYSPELANTYSDGKIEAVNIFRHSNLEIYPSLGSTKYQFKNFWHPAGGNLPDADCKGYATPLPDSEFALYTMVHCLAQFDPQMILHGWWGNPENGEHEAFRKFYTAFRNIPAGHYDFAPGTNDPVAVRIGNKGFYLVNREAFPVMVSFKLNGKNFMKNLSGCEVYSQILSSRPNITEVKTTVDDNDLHILKSQRKKLGLIRKLYAEDHQPVKRLDTVITRVDHAIAEGCYSHARNLMLTKAALDALNEVPINLTTRYDWMHKKMSVQIRNIDPEDFSGSISVTSYPKDWTVEQNTISVQNIKCGETRTVEFNFSGGDLHDYDVFKINISGNNASADYRYRFPCRFAKEEDIEVDPLARAPHVTSKWHLCGNDKSVTKRLAKPVVGRYMLLWNEEGSGIRVLAQIDDPQFIEPVQRGSMYLKDSIQIYFDQKNNATIDAIGYDNDDIVFQVGLLDGKPEVWRETGDSQVVDVPAEITHENDKTLYDVFIPASLLPQADLSVGGTIGFSILFNQLMADKKGEFMIKLAPMGDPYLHPGNWIDFYFSKRRPGNHAILQLVSGIGLLSDVTTINSNLSDKPGNNCVYFESHELGLSPQEFGFTFIPPATGTIRLALLAGYGSRVNYCTVTADGAKINNADFSQREWDDNDTGISDWTMSEKKPSLTNDGVDLAMGRSIAQSITVTQGVPVTITAKVCLPEDTE